MRWIGTPILALILTGTAGCVLVAPTDPYAGMAARRAGAWETPPTGTNTPSRKVQGPLTLDEAVAVALANNPELAAAGYDVDAAGARRDVAWGQRLPNLRAVGGYNRHLSGQRLVPASRNGEPGYFSEDIYSGDLVVGMPLFTGGRITSEIDAAELLERAAGHRLARTSQELVFDVTGAFYGILAQRQVIESLEFSTKTLQEHLKRIQDLIDAQKAARVDRLRTEVRVADLQQRLARERNVLTVQQRVLTNLLGLDSPEAPVKPSGTLVFERRPVAQKGQALADAYALRPDYQAARAALEAQAKAVDAARAGHWPTVSLQGSYGGRWAGQQVGDIPRGVNGDEDVGRVGVFLDIPLFEGGRIRARVRQEKARLSAARERLRRLELQIQLDVVTALSNLESAGQRMEATEAAIRQAEESLRIERQKYELGKGSITDVLDAQSALLETQTQYYRALADYKIASAQYRLAVGEQK